MTTSWTLWHDSLRDLRDLGARHIQLKSLEITDLSDLRDIKEGVLFVTYKCLTKHVKNAKCHVCLNDLDPVSDPSISTTCQSCKDPEAKVEWVCTQECEACGICDQCHSLLLVPRVKAVSDWMKDGESDGDGVLVLDESHSAKVSTTVTASGVCMSQPFDNYSILFPPFIYFRSSSFFFSSGSSKTVKKVGWRTHDGSETCNFVLAPFPT